MEIIPLSTVSRREQHRRERRGQCETERKVVGREKKMKDGDQQKKKCVHYTLRLFATLIYFKVNVSLPLRMPDLAVEI